MTTSKRTLGRSGIAVSPIGFGCWAIGGPAFRDGNPIGWGKVDDEESVAAIHAALDAGVTFFDTANVYGAGHSERVLARALAGKWDDVVIATKFGNLIDEDAKQAVGRDASPASIREQCDASLARLGTDVIDLYQFHIGDYDPVQAEEVVGALEGLVEAGKIRSFGWSTDDPERARVFARSPHCAAIQLHANVIDDNATMVDLIESENLAGVNRGPLAMGALTGKFDRQTTFADDDVRRRFDFSGKEGRTLDALERIRDVLTSGGRTLAQGSLCWLLARTPAFVPIPGIRTVAQAQDNAGAIAHGPLSESEMAEIESTLKQLSLR
ncbi:aldo/keto reductase [Actinopolymorpha pittospori]|uniref:Aryl-alcohol dehydrogenase-like predicted oxidoreductase n=1 Tax=Actinopolymorpha pittospori TaxID=648752 RepID=A0A927MV60_9ACTN|nr:aldo/keto reductase [Actinopolymorpha pittospori]MBE1607475.1 aryl-alcohol dehydrogenase-like predicted oxidoreductase [Actinopolymorpha pittospori]